MINFEITEDEKLLLLKRRELFEKRQKRGALKVQHQNNQPLTGHCKPEVVHQGRMTDPDHPMHWFEKEIFSQISNMEHQAEHAKIGELLKMPVQTSSRDRVYHALCHLDVLWAEGRLPIRYKHRYEEYKKKHKIDTDNIHPSHKTEGTKYPEPQNKRDWNPEDYQEYSKTEKFVPTKIYEYAKAI